MEAMILISMFAVAVIAIVEHHREHERWLQTELDRQEAERQAQLQRELEEKERQAELRKKQEKERIAEQLKKERELFAEQKRKVDEELREKLKKEKNSWQVRLEWQTESQKKPEEIKQQRKARQEEKEKLRNTEAKKKANTNSFEYSSFFDLYYEPSASRTWEDCHDKEAPPILGKVKYQNAYERYRDTDYFGASNQYGQLYFEEDFDDYEQSGFSSYLNNR